MFEKSPTSLQGHASELRYNCLSVLAYVMYRIRLISGLTGEDDTLVDHLLYFHDCPWLDKYKSTMLTETHVKHTCEKHLRVSQPAF